MSSPPSPNGLLQPGTQIGFYTVERCIGRGGFGAVYQVRRGPKAYALKVSALRLGDQSSEDRIDLENRVGREVAALNSLRHPNIVRVHGYDAWPDEDGHPYIVMDFVDGLRLFDWRRAKRPSLRVCIQVVAKVALALAAMHRIEVFHRDLKSENVLVRHTLDGSEPVAEPVIVDFGIARPTGSHTVTRQGLWLGTVRYLSPEYVKYWKTPEFAKGVPFPWAPTTDLYAAGVMLYELVTGQPQFRAKSDAEMMLLIKEADPRPPRELNPNVPEPLSTLILELLSKDPAQRIQTGEQLAERLTALSAEAGASDAWDRPFSVPGDLQAVAQLAADARVDAGAGTVAERPKPVLEAGRLKAGSAPDEPKQLEAGELKAGSAPTEPPAPPDDLTLGHGEPDAKGTPHMQHPPGPPPFRAPDGENVRKLSTELRSAERAPEGEGASLSEAHRVALELAGDERPRRSKVPLVVGGGVLLVFALVLMLATSGHRRKHAPVNLIQEVQRADVARVDAGADTDEDGPSAPVPARTVQLPDGELEERSRAAVSSPEPVAGSSDPHQPGAPHRRGAAGSSNADEEEIDRLLAEEYARDGGRPRIPGPTSTTGPVGPAWLHTAERIDAPAAPPSGFGIPMGAHIRAKLKTNLDSRTVADGYVEARLDRPFAVNGEVKLPSRTMIYGKALASQGRFNIHFTRMVLPGGHEVPLDGLAYDIEEREAGLKASRSTVGSPQKGEGRGVRIAKDAAQVLVGAISQGDVATQAAQRAAQETLSDDGASGGAADNAAYLDAGADFDIFVEQAL